MHKTLDCTIPQNMYIYKNKLRGAQDNGNKGNFGDEIFL